MDERGTSELDVLSDDAGFWHAEVEVRPSPDAPVQRYPSG
jgi:hypothetical protein